MTLVDLTPGTAVPPVELTFSTLDLFLFSAASWHPHRIHFDQDYAREEEGHVDLLVHGPLQAVHIFQTLTNALPEGARLVNARYRHQSPLYIGKAAIATGEVVEVDSEAGTVEFELWMEDVEAGKRTTSGHAVVQLASN